MNAHPTNPMLEAALSWARQGWPVFPCNPENKRPLTGHGFKDATCDTVKITEWWTRWPCAMIGVPTGKVSGLFVVDADFDETKGVDGVKALFELGKIPDTAIAITPRGGRHVCFKWREGLGNSVGIIAPGIDTRGQGGYVCIAPSKRADGKQYRWENPPGLFSPADIPEWLLARLVKKKGGHGSATGDAGERERVYARATLDEILREVGSAKPGNRNDRLNRAAFRLGTMVGAGWLLRSDVEAALLAAAHLCGLVADDSEPACRKTIESGLAAGMADPHKSLEERGHQLAGKRHHQEQPGAAPAEGGGKLTLDNFHAYLPMHSYILAECRGLLRRPVWAKMVATPSG